MDAELLTESPMMTAATFGLDGIPKEPCVTIASVGREEQEQTDKKTGKKERWGILKFLEPWAKPYKVNATAKRALIMMFGRETDKWIGKRIVLFALPGVYFKERGVAVRIKGSPDIREKMSYQMKQFGAREKLTYELIPTGGPAVAGSSSAKPAAPVPAAAATPPPVAASSSTADKDPGPAAPATPAASSTVAARAATPGGVPFGPYKTGAGGAARLIAELDDPELLETVTFGEQKIAAEPNASWATSVGAALVSLRAELERRYNVRMAAEDAAEKTAAAGGAPPAPAPSPREPGSDDGTEPDF